MGDMVIYRCSNCRNTSGKLVPSKKGSTQSDMKVATVLEEFNPPPGWDLVVKDNGEKEVFCPECKGK